MSERRAASPCDSQCSRACGGICGGSMAGCREGGWPSLHSMPERSAGMFCAAAMGLGSPGVSCATIGRA
eukprot:scaffold13303_cov70-Phaeocystis_antarctica.AAC.12